MKSKRKSLYDDEALQTMLRQAKEAELPFYDNAEESSSESDGSSSQRSSQGSDSQEESKQPQAKSRLKVEESEESD